MKKHRFLPAAAGFAAGVVNNLLGAGGGMLLVPLLQKSGLSAVKSHATSVAVIFPLCAAGAAGYLRRGDVLPADALPYVLPVLGGAFCGAWLLPRLAAQWLHRLFGLTMLWAAWRLLWS